MPMKTCAECGRTFDLIGASWHETGSRFYCSDKCYREAKSAKQAAQAAGRAKSDANMGTVVAIFKLVGIAFVALGALFTVLCYKFPKFLKGKSKKLLVAYIGLWAALIVAVIIYFAFFSPAAVTGIKTQIVSASCETEEDFVSILTEASAKDKESWTKIEGEEFATYSGQARDVVKERNSVLKDAVYLVRFPDSINAYVWFNTEGQVTSAYVYKTN